MNSQYKKIIAIIATILVTIGLQIIAIQQIFTRSNPSFWGNQSQNKTEMLFGWVWILCFFVLAPLAGLFIYHVIIGKIAGPIIPPGPRSKARLTVMIIALALVLPISVAAFNTVMQNIDTQKVNNDRGQSKESSEARSQASKDGTYRCMHEYYLKYNDIALKDYMYAINKRGGSADRELLESQQVAIKKIFIDCTDNIISKRESLDASQSIADQIATDAIRILQTVSPEKLDDVERALIQKS